MRSQAFNVIHREYNYGQNCWKDSKDADIS